MTRKYEPNVDAWREEIYSSGRYKVVCTFDRRLSGFPDYITLTEFNGLGNYTRAYVIRGELAHIFMREFAALRREPVSRPQLLAEWVTRMDNIELALRTIGHRDRTPS